MKTKAKELVLGILALASSVAALWFWHRVTPALIAGEFTSYERYLPVFLALLVSAIFFALAGLLVSSPWIAYGGTTLGIGIPVLFAPATTPVALLGLVAILLLAYALYEIRKELSFSLGFSVTKALKVGLPLYFTVVALVSCAYYFSQVDEDKALSIFLPPTVIDFGVNIFSRSLSSWVGGDTVDLNATVDQFLGDVIRSQSASQCNAIDRIPQAELDQMITDQRANRGLSSASLPEILRPTIGAVLDDFGTTIDQSIGRDLRKVLKERCLAATASSQIGTLITSQRSELSQQFGVKLKGTERVRDVFTAVIVNRVSDLVGPYRRYLPIAATVAFFFAFKLVTLPIYFLTLFFTFALMKFLRFTNIVKKESKMIEVEKLVL